VTLETLAENYRTTTRTLHRWKSSGVEIFDPGAVADHLLKVRSPRLETLVAVADIVRQQNADRPNPWAKGFSRSLSSKK